MEKDIGFQNEIRNTVNFAVNVETALNRMASFETRTVNTILRVIRARRQKPSPRNVIAPAGNSTPPGPINLREAVFSDFAAVVALKKSWGLFPDSLENWERLWRHNPVLSETLSKRPIGWVLEADGKIVGYLGNISQIYRYGDRTLKAVTASGFVVEPAYRGVSISLISAFYRQAGVDLYLNTTAIEVVGKINRAFKAASLPQPDYDAVLFWVLRPFSSTRAILLELEMGRTLSYVGGLLGSIALGLDSFFRRRGPRSGATRYALSEIGVTEIGEEFESVWMEKVGEGIRLLADRTPATLKWHFDIPGDDGTVRVLCCRANGKLVGYAIVRNDGIRRKGPRRTVIADMLAINDDPEILRSLFVAVYDHAKRAGSHIVEVLGFPPNIRQLCFPWNPYLRKYPACPYYYKAVDPDLHKALSQGSAWYATPFDGDTTLMP
jgi:hypothetical protein